jgi:hypothetical protein
VDKPASEILDGADMNQDLHQLIAYCWTHGARHGTGSEFPSPHLIALAEEFLRKHRAPEAEQPAAPDPGEGWLDETVGIATIDPKVHLEYLSRVEPQAPGFVDFELFDDEPLLAFKDRSGETWYTYQAVAMRGFMGFVYADDDEESLCLHPCRWRDEVGSGAIEFPVAVRFAKDKP